MVPIGTDVNVPVSNVIDGQTRTGTGQMAYLDFRDGTQATMAAAAHTPGERRVDRPAQPDGLTALEWRVVMLARQDGIASLSANPRPGRLRALLFGTRPDPRLADPRLEALRRVAVHAWHHGLAVPAAEVARFTDAGFGAAALQRVVLWVDARR